MKRWRAKKFLLFIVLIFVSNMVQMLISPLWNYRHPFIDIPLLIVIFYSRWESPSSAILFGWLAGLFQDISSGGALGINSLSKLVVAFAVCEMEGKLELKEIIIVKGAFIMVLTALDGIVGYFAASRCFLESMEPFIFNLNFLFSLILNPLMYIILFHFPENIKRRKSLGESY